MRRALFCAVSAVAGCLALSSAVRAGGPNPDDYPLRVQIFRYMVHPRSSREPNKWGAGAPDWVDGQGQADVIEHGQPQGFLFNNSCMVELRASVDYETFPARWKKRERTLEILEPEPGKPWNMASCDLQTDMRTGFAFYWEDGVVKEGPAEVYKKWMDKHQFDPEKGKEVPLEDAPTPAESRSNGSGPSAPQ
jgi:hypothetical protein